MESPESVEPAESAVSTASAESTEPASPADADKGGRPDRRGLAIAAVALLACGGLIGYGFLNTDEKPKPRAVPTAEVTYEVTGKGTAELSYLARSESGKATVEKRVVLPWKKTVQVPLGKAPTIGLVLDEKGGQASCSLAIRGKHVQLATAFGSYGRATCTGELPAGRH
ncbi:hypothetical protein [Streptomyces sp. SLBN-118]|uniref:hypothetical protein n=1 Tax=Streptomyces sp. SLBN-118 TaxID=2768454 RepID=UPI0021B2DCF7|nr:hypothetical protein [Streptomyces sp. SLBN-118]